MAPADVNLNNEIKVWRHLYGKELLKTPLYLQRQLENRKIPISHKGLRVDDPVRLSKRKHTFEKAYFQNWTDEIFFVAHISKNTTPVTFRIKDHEEQILDGVFYRQELIPIKVNEQVYAVEKIIKRQRRGRKMYFLVKWRGYPESQNSWITSEQLRPLSDAS